MNEGTCYKESKFGGGAKLFGYLDFNMALNQFALREASLHTITLPNNGVFLVLTGCALVSIKVILHLNGGFLLFSCPKYQIMSSMFQQCRIVSP